MNWQRVQDIDSFNGIDDIAGRKKKLMIVGGGEGLLAFADVEPIEEIGQRNQHEERIPNRHDFKEAGDLEEIIGLRGVGVDENIDVRGEE